MKTIHELIDIFQKKERLYVRWLNSDLEFDYEHLDENFITLVENVTKEEFQGSVWWHVKLLIDEKTEHACRKHTKNNYYNDDGIPNLNFFEVHNREKDGYRVDAYLGENIEGVIEVLDDEYFAPSDSPFLEWLKKEYEQFYSVLLNQYQQSLKSTKQ
jgi:hypothetical protein